MDLVYSVAGESQPGMPIWPRNSVSASSCSWPQHADALSRRSNIVGWLHTLHAISRSCHSHEQRRRAREQEVKPCMNHDRTGNELGTTPARAR